MSDVNTTVEQEVKTVELLDCGSASQVTKGAMFSIYFEGTWPPFDRELVF